MTVLEIEGRKVEVSDDFLVMSPEDQERTVTEIAEGMGGNQPVMSVLNEGIARSVGGIVDGATHLTNEFLSPDRFISTPDGEGNFPITGTESGPKIENAFGGSESIRQGMEAVGADPSRRDPENMFESIVIGSGEALGALVPLGLGAKLLSQLTGTAKGVGDTIQRPFVNTPVRATSAEVAAGGGARAGGDIADDLAGEDSGTLPRFAGEVLGSLAAATGPGALTRAAGATARALPGTGTAIRASQKAIAPFTEAGGRARASERLRGLVADPERTAATLDSESIGGLTPAQRTGEEGLMRLENAIADNHPEIRDRLAARRIQSRETLSGDLNAPGQGRTVDDARDFIEKRREEFRTRLTDRLNAARQNASSQLESVSPQMRESASSVIVREEIEKAYSSASNQERFLWGKIPRDTAVGTQNVKTVFTEIAADTSRAQFDDIPTEAQRLLGDGGFSGSETVREMHGLYSRLRQTAREALSGVAPKENRARIANMLADAILEDLGAIKPNSTAVGRQINEARAFSRVVNETFNQGTVGRITGRQRNGGNAIAPEVALSATVGRAGTRGAVAVDDIRSATAGDTADTAIQDFLKGRFTDRTAPRGDFSANRAQDFMRVNRETMDRFPTLAEQFTSTTATQRAVDVTSDRVNAIVRALDNPRDSVGAAFVNASPGNEVAAAVFKTRNPAAAAGELRRQASRDQTGNALAGLKSGFLDYLVQSASRGLDAQGNRNVSGDTLSGLLTEGKTASAIRQILDPAEIQRLNRVAREFRLLDKSAQAGSLDAPIDDLPNTIISFLGRTFAARQGAKAGAGTSGASLLTANFASRRMQRILEGLTNDRASALLRDAVEDSELFAALLTPQTSQTRSRHVERRLTEWLVGYAATELSQDNEEVGAQ
ncbi:hypothetical protein [Pseudohalocynthiibacter sp. F2068]|jgi:hypothetical protein|uniref:hypothetical protein n=1 Tax=Pseudohalocynthiibacter sp. F2068 TaxID=2926418 RepID=UPI001FF5795D|nr:hypothetical protein [Pseudohalocynthiibacter sp. F2068]MCK0102538.1 hypothetical protein [Pseudohalocynthiibacter sp. F2068]